jgi:RNA polymerase sigma-70 factor (ECF subfamily)
MEALAISRGDAGSGDADVSQTSRVDTRQVLLRYSSMVYRVALTHTKCLGDAEDVFQEVFLAYHRKQPECRDAEHRKAWLIRTALNCARRVSTSSWRTRVVLISAQASAPMPEEFHFRTDEQDAVFQALGRLPETYRTVLHLFYFEDFAVSRIAGLLDLAEGAVKMRLSRGRALMREQLERFGFRDFDKQPESSARGPRKAPDRATGEEGDFAGFLNGGVFDE